MMPDSEAKQSLAQGPDQNPKPLTVIIDKLPLVVAGQLTLFLIVAGAALPLIYFSGEGPPPPFYDYLDKIGSYLAGLFSIISFIWICATFYVQAIALAHQGMEIQQQRIASEDAARSYRIQFALAMHKIAVESLSSSVKAVLNLVYSDKPERLSEAHRAFSEGATDVYFILAASNEVREDLRDQLKYGNATLRYLLSDCLNQDQRILQLIKTSEVPSASKLLLYDHHPAHFACEAFENLIRA